MFANEEADIISLNISLLQTEIRIAHRRAQDASHHGFRRLVTEVQGTTGRPRVVIDEAFLRWAYTYRSTSGIAAFLGVSRPVVRNALLQYGIAEPGEDPFIRLPVVPLASTASQSATPNVAQGLFAPVPERRPVSTD